MVDPTWRACRKKPVVVHVRDAVPGENVFTREGLTLAKDDDLVMRGVDGELYPIGREIFERTYDLVDDGATPSPAKSPIVEALHACARFFRLDPSGETEACARHVLQALAERRAAPAKTGEPPSGLHAALLRAKEDIALFAEARDSLGQNLLIAGAIARIDAALAATPTEAPADNCICGVCPDCRARALDSQREMLWAQHGMDDDSIAAARRTPTAAPAKTGESAAWCEKCREYRPCSTCTYPLCSMGCGRPLPYADLVAAVQRGDALPSKAFCWGSPECEDLIAFYGATSPTETPPRDRPESADVASMIAIIRRLRGYYRVENTAFARKVDALLADY